MAGTLTIIARDFLGFKNARKVPWQQLCYEHVQARTKVGELLQTCHGKPSVDTRSKKRAI
jgi:hypothetical protein